jgi:hypothetical protein
MYDLIDILIGFLLFMFTAVSLTMVCGWLILQVLGTRKENKRCCHCSCCKEKVEGLSNPIPTQEACCKDDMSDCSCDEPFIIEGINDFERKTEITGMGGKGGPVDSIRSRNKDYDKMIRESEYVGEGVVSIPKKHNRDYINFLDEQERKSKKDYHNLKDSEPLEENDPNIHKK